ncbi:ABC transporter substrate-binding protein [Ideonella azotifigens]|uniref:ABC transporter substrate-binding protein n=2 Tax=Ideonella azotifigens TaxID=513160 RepID=A0ABP3VMS0_9BURK
MPFSRRLSRLLHAGLLSCSAMLLSAAPLARASDILIGQSAELSGEASAKDNVEGAEAYFRAVNARGGVNGSKIRLISLDDKRDPKLAVENTKTLIDDKNVIALFSYRSTPTVQAVLPMVQERKIPLVGPITGAAALRKPGNDYVYNLRASYADEAAKIVQQIGTMGISRVAVFFQEDAFGKEVRDHFETAIKSQKMTEVASASFNRQDMQVAPAVAKIAAAEPQAVLMACTPKGCALFIRAMRARGSHPQFIAVSNVNGQEFFTELASECRGVAISQVVPHPTNIGVAVVNEFQASRKGMESPPPVNFAAMEGFLNAKLLVEGLKRAGPNPTSAKLAAALDSFRDLDLGGVRVGFSPQERAGPRFVELTVLTEDCKVRR